MRLVLLCLIAWLLLAIASLASGGVGPDTGGTPTAPGGIAAGQRTIPGPLAVSGGGARSLGAARGTRLLRRSHRQRL